MNQKNNKIFNLKLYIEGIKQLKMIGIMSLIILSLAAFLIPLGTNISTKNIMDNAMKNGIARHVNTIFNLITMHPFLIAVFLIVTPLMVLYLFGFLNKRNASDFYHSIPDTRECLFISYVASILTWALGIILFSTVVCFVSTLFFKYVELNILSIFVGIFYIFAGCVFVVGAFLIAMSLSGTVFTNLAVALMVMFVPRIFVIAFTLSLSSMLSFVPMSYANKFLFIRYNVPIDLLMGLFGGSAETGIASISTGIYAIVAGLILCVIGCLLFKIRKSEAATCAAVNSKLQTVFRIIPAFVICIIPSTLIIEYIYFTDYSMSSNALFEIVVCYIVALVAYFLYELITTKKWKNLVKAIPGLIPLVILNVLYIGIMYASAQVITSDVPEASEITAVRICDNQIQDYFNVQTEKVNLTSEEIKQIVSEQLKNTVSMSGRTRITMSYTGQEVITLAIQKGNRTIYRNVSFDAESYKKFFKEVWATEDYNNAYYRLPELGKNQTNVSIDMQYENLINVEEIYKAYVQEVKNIPTDKYYQQIIMGRLYDAIGVIRVNTTIGTHNYNLLLPISKSTPNAMKKYIEAVNSINNNNPIDDFLERVNSSSKNLGKENGEYYYLSMSIYDSNDVAYYGNASFNNGRVDYTENGLDILQKVSEKLNSQDLKQSNDSIVVKLDLSIQEVNENDYYEDTVFYTKIYIIDKETFDMLMKYTGNTPAYYQ